MVWFGPVMLPPPPIPSGTGIDRTGAVDVTEEECWHVQQRLAEAVQEVEQLRMALTELMAPTTSTPPLVVEAGAEAESEEEEGMGLESGGAAGAVPATGHATVDVVDVAVQTITTTVAPPTLQASGCSGSVVLD